MAPGVGEGDGGRGGGGGGEELGSMGAGESEISSSNTALEGLSTIMDTSGEDRGSLGGVIDGDGLGRGAGVLDGTMDWLDEGTEGRGGDERGGIEEERRADEAGTTSSTPEDCGMGD